MSRRSARPAVAAALAWVSAIVADPAAAGEIYRWVDADGGVHYSDTKPQHDAPVTTIDIESPRRTDYDPVEDPYSILNQAARIHQIWLDLEEARQARARERIDAMAQAPRYRPPAYDSYLEYSNYNPYYSSWPAGSSDYRRGYGRQQIYALRTLDLLGPRPASINSGVHQDRVFRSQFLPIVPPPPPPPRPTPR